MSGATKPQVAHVLQVVGTHLRVRLAAAQQRLHDAPHALLLQLVGELFQVRLPAQDELFARGVDRLGGDRPAAVASPFAGEARLLGQCVDQPRLAGGQLPHRLQRRCGEPLPGLRGVLAEQRAHLGLREVVQPQGSRLDVEGAAAGDHALLGRRVDAVVAHVAHPAQNHALREAGRALVVAGAQLPQHRDQGVADQRVDFVDQQHQGRGVGLRPPCQHFLQRACRAGLLQDARPQGRQRLVAERPARAPRQLCEDGAHRLCLVFARRLSRLHVDVHATIVALGSAVQQVAQRQQRRGLAGLPRCVKRAFPDLKTLGQIDWDAMVGIRKQQIIDLATCQFIERPEDERSVDAPSHGWIRTRYVTVISCHGVD